MSFPSNPAVNDEFVKGNKTYKWTGYSWSRVSTTAVSLAANAVTVNAIQNASITSAKLDPTFVSSLVHTSSLTTANVSEVTNLYFNNTRAISALTSGSGISIAANGRITGASQYSNTDVQAYLGNISGALIPSGDEVYNLGSSTKKWANLFLSGNTIVLGQTKIESSSDGSIAIKSTNTQVTSAISFSSNGYIAAPSGPLATASGSVSTTPRIANVRVTDSSYTYLDDTAANNGANGFVEINGANFDSGATVIVGTSSASSVSFINSTRLRVALPSLTSGTYPVYVINSDGSTATRINGLNISGFPTFNTASGSLGNFPEGTRPNILINAISDTAITYALVSGSSLPANLSLNSNGLITGNLTSQASNTTYNFSISATDVELQNTNRSFSLTALYDPLTWFSPISNTSYIYTGGSNSQVTINLHANLIGQSNVSYSANAFLGNLTLSGNTISGYLPYVSSNNVVFSSLISASNPAGRTSNITIIFVAAATTIFTAEYLIVGGGGSGGDVSGGGGGGGGAITGTLSLVSGTCYPIAIGSGGSAPGYYQVGNTGSNSCIGSSIIGYGGGGGGAFTGYSYYGCVPCCNGLPGGSGGGGGETQGVGGTGIQGCNGGNAFNTWSCGLGAGGGGGGQTQTGIPGAPGTPGQGNGGLGLYNSFSGSNLMYGYGGGGSFYADAPCPPRSCDGNGQISGGQGNSTGGVNSPANRGGGGGGNSFGVGWPGWFGPLGPRAAGNGGSGIAIIRYAGPQKATGGNITTIGSNVVHVFTASGTLTTT